MLVVICFWKFLSDALFIARAAVSVALLKFNPGKERVWNSSWNTFSYFRRLKATWCFLLPLFDWVDGWVAACPVLYDYACWGLRPSYVAITGTATSLHRRQLPHYTHKRNARTMSATFTQCRCEDRTASRCNWAPPGQVRCVLCFAIVSN